MASKHSAHRTKPARQRRRALTLSDLLRASFDARGQAVSDKVAEAFGMNKTQLASTLGLSRESLYKAKRAEAEKTQARVRELLEIIVRVLPWAGGQQQAMAWYRAQPIAAFGDRTAESLVKEGKAAAVRDYLDYMAQGNFA
ncbi:MAG: antitoxin Xre/MbcA/ParS toxin-binding domain-containing protein [Steroidobacteraceae bacterium]